VLVAAGALAFALSVHFGLIGGPQFTEGLVVAERPMSLNPLVDASDPAVVDVGHLLYRSLLKLDSTGYPTDDLAASWTVSGTGLVYTVALPPNLEWSNGAPITPADVVATERFALSPQASDANLATALRGVKVTAAQSTIVFTLPTARASFAATLTQMPILPLGEMSAPALLAAATHPTVPLPTSGPYDVQSAGPLTVLLQTNPHTAMRPTIKSYELRLFVRFADASYAFSHGSIGALLATTPEELSTLMSVKGAQAETMTTPAFVDLMFNERVPALASSVVRHAIGIAINRTTLVAGALNDRGGVIQTGPFSAGIPWVGPPASEAISPSAAASLLQANGWIPGADGVRHHGSTQLALTLAVPDIGPLPLVAQEVATQLAGIGVQVTVSGVAPQSFLAGTLDGGHFELAIDVWNPVPDPDVSAFWRSSAVPPHGYNMTGGVPDPFLDAALDMLAESPARATRIGAAAQVAALVADDAPAVFLYTPRVSVVFRAPAPVAPMPSVGPESARYDDVAAWQPP
jgi:peptide/nickel transport system substrate-binding protein